MCSTRRDSSRNVFTQFLSMYMALGLPAITTLLDFQRPHLNPNSSFSAIISGLTRFGDVFVVLGILSINEADGLANCNRDLDPISSQSRSGMCRSSLSKGLK